MPRLRRLFPIQSLVLLSFCFFVKLFCPDLLSVFLLVAYFYLHFASVYYYYCHDGECTLCSKKLWSRTLAITLSNLNRFLKFLHCCKEKEISNKPCVINNSHYTLDMLLHYLVKYNNSKLTQITHKIQ